MSDSTPRGTLPRYVVEWQGPTFPSCKLMDDGYWTPWHLADAEIERLEAELRIKDRGIDSAISLNNEQVQEIGRLERDLAMAMDAARKGDDARAILGGMQMDAANYDTNVAIVTQQRDQLERENAALRAALMTAGS